MSAEELLLEGEFGGPPGTGGGLPGTGGSLPGTGRGLPGTGRGPRFHLLLTRTELRIEGVDTAEGGTGTTTTTTLRLEDVVGCHTLRSPSHPRVAFFAVYAYPVKGKKATAGFWGGSRIRRRPPGSRRHRRAPVFRVDSAPDYEGNRATAERWARVICCLVRGVPLPSAAELPPEPRPRRLLLLLNPFGGRGQALNWCQSHVLPMISEAGISFNLIQTERANHAWELVKGLSLEEWDGIVTASGDGLLYEVLNGLMSRPDWASALRTPLGILPCGSGNGLAAAVNCHAGQCRALGVSLLQNCSVLLCRAGGATPARPLDVVSVTTASGRRLFSALAVAWGLVADVDVGTEPFRALGLVDDLLTPLDRPLPPGWVTLEGDFVLVAALCQSHLGAELVAAPGALPDDGLIHLCFVRAGVSRVALLRALLAMARGDAAGGDAGDDDDDDDDEEGAAPARPTPRRPAFCRVLARAFRLEPLEPRGVLTVDGERVEYGPLQGQIHPGLARIMGLPPAGAAS